MSKQQQSTTAPVVDDGVEWADPDVFGKKFSIGHASIYRLIKAGAIKSVIMRYKGGIKGQRLISVQSMRDHLARQNDRMHPRHVANIRKAATNSVASRRAVAVANRRKRLETRNGGRKEARKNGLRHP